MCVCMYMYIYVYKHVHFLVIKLHKLLFKYPDFWLIIMNK